MIINSQKALDDYISKLKADFEQYRYLEAEHKVKGRVRSNQQNKALHKYLEMLAVALNDAGYDMKRTLKQDFDIPWTRDSAKEYLWRPIQKAVIGEESTTKATRAEYPKIWEVLNRHLSAKFGISVPWPSED